MTKEEARAYFIDSNEKIISAAKDENSYNYETQQIEDVFMRRTFEANELVIKALEQEPCEDAISRILKRMWNCRGKHTTSIDKVKMEQIIRDELSSTNPMADTLDKIETDIETLFKYYPFTRGGAYINKDDVNKIINKYKLEGSEK